MVKTRPLPDQPNESLLRAISREDISEVELRRALAALGAVTEPPQFWSRMANAPDYPIFHRRLCVFQLFRRHVHPGMKLSELASLLDRPTWLRDEDVQMVSVLAGKLPVQWTLADTVIVLAVFPEAPQEEAGAIYLRLAGKVAVNDFLRLVRGCAASSAVGEAVILEVGFSEGAVPPAT
jgi:hypothetical protein